MQFCFACRDRDDGHLSILVTVIILITLKINTKPVLIGSQLLDKLSLICIVLNDNNHNRNFNIYTYTFVEKMLGLYFAGHTIQFSSFNYLFLWKKTECCRINLRHNFITRKTNVLRLHQLRAVGGKKRVKLNLSFGVKKGILCVFGNFNKANYFFRAKI